MNREITLWTARISAVQMLNSFVVAIVFYVISWRLFEESFQSILFGFLGTLVVFRGVARYISTELELTSWRLIYSYGLFPSIATEIAIKDLPTIKARITTLGKVFKYAHFEGFTTYEGVNTKVSFKFIKNYGRLQEAIKDMSDENKRI